MSLFFVSIFKLYKHIVEFLSCSLKVLLSLHIFGVFGLPRGKCKKLKHFLNKVCFKIWVIQNTLTELFFLIQKRKWTLEFRVLILLLKKSLVLESLLQYYNIRRNDRYSWLAYIKWFVITPPRTTAVKLKLPSGYI